MNLKTLDVCDLEECNGGYRQGATAFIRKHQKEIMNALDDTLDFVCGWGFGVWDEL